MSSNGTGFNPGAAGRLRANSLAIRTPEGITFTILLAGPVVRFLALWIDLACIGAAMTVFRVVFILFGLISADLSMAVYILVYFVVSMGYMAFAEWYWRGQTIGKRLFGLRVIDAQGFRIRSSQIIIRNIMRLVDALPGFYLLGGAACFLSRRSQRLGDLAANTVVVRNPRMQEPDMDRIFAGKYNSLKEYPYLAARLRQKVSPGEAGIALQALMRRDEFGSSERASLFENLAAHFRGLVGFPEDAVFGITDEQYVRDVVEILFR